MGILRWAAANRFQAVTAFLHRVFGNACLEASIRLFWPRPSPLLLLSKGLCKTWHAERGRLVVLKYCVVQLGPKHQRLLAAAP